MTHKNLLFIIDGYYQGGSNRSLENLLSFIKDNYHIHIYSLRKTKNTSYKSIYGQYNIIQSSLIFSLIYNFNLIKRFRSIILWWFHIDVFHFLWSKEMKYIYKRINVDIAIGFQEGDTHYFASYFYNKIYWIHCDFAYPHSFHKYYDFFYKKNTIVKIICVSEYTAASFNSYIHNGNNADYLLNTINIDNIIEQSNKNITDIDDTNFSIISIGRFVALKQFHLIPRIVNAINLMNPQTDFKWYIIASGSEDMKLTINEINKYNLEKQIIILGERNNPYPYYKNADLTVCLSRSESFSYILFESMILGTPVISNNFPVAQQLIDNKYGIVCHIDLIAYEIFNLLNNKKKYLKLKNNLKYFTYPNKEILLKFEKIISGIL